jgi:CBS domain-containing protein
VKVKDVMSTPVVTVSVADSVARAAKLMADNGTGALVVTNQDHHIGGVVTDRDLVTRCIALGYDPKTFQVGDCIATDYANQSHPRTISPEAELHDAAEAMAEAGVHRLPVTEDGRHALGMISFDEIALDIREYLSAFLAVAARDRRRHRSS